MRFTTAQYLEKEVVTVSIRNNNASAAILDGQPVFAENNNVTSVNLGVDVRTYSTANGGSIGALFVGICKTNKVGGLVAGDVGEAVVYGFTDIILQRRTRTATNATWPSIASTISAGDVLIPETVNNYISFLSSVANSGVGAMMVAGESIAGTSTTEASSLYAAGTVDTIRMKAFIRSM